MRFVGSGFVDCVERPKLCTPEVVPTSAELADAVDVEVAKQLAVLPTRDIASQARAKPAPHA